MLLGMAGSQQAFKAKKHYKNPNEMSFAFVVEKDTKLQLESKYIIIIRGLSLSATQKIKKYGCIKCGNPF